MRVGRGLWANSLTVVNYHRIDDPTRPGFDSFKPNISATPRNFDRQLTYLKKWFNVISVDNLTDWLAGGRPLPPHAALITFDDGYLDNHVHAYPILRQQDLPALIFLTTGHIGTDAPFYWDLGAYCFHHTLKESVRFRDGSEHGWKDAPGREAVNKTWTESLKNLPETEKQAWADRLPEQLGVSIPEGYFRGLMLNWDLIREMSAGGLHFGGHTVNHPILTRIPLGEASREISDCKQRIEAELGKPALSFAYPNGMATDLDGLVQNAVREAGYQAAFTLLNGPASLREVRSEPFAIRRIFISHKHGMQEFATLLSPMNRLRKD
jgi:peptidoglycan/xylan/chitin deacetylase (PgdA/CDA1 family)